MTAEAQATGLPMSSNVLCTVYAVISVAALVATWSQNLTYVGSDNFVVAFFNDTKANGAARSITVDLLLFLLPVAILMVSEARKHSIPYVWVYILGSAVTAISITFPLFLIARELRIAKTDPTRLPAADVISLAVAAIVIWVDVV